jgi:cysteinyl-tRNA synthetase
MIVSQQLLVRRPLAERVAVLVCSRRFVQTVRSRSAASRRRHESPLLFLQKQWLPSSFPFTQQQLQCKSYCSSVVVRCPELGSLDASSSSMTLFNSLTEQYESVLPSREDERSNTTKGIACYTCGPTVYAPAHLGHARTYVWLDILRRCLEHQAQIKQQPAPLFVMNITDVDDKILKAAQAKKKSPLQLARRYEAEFWEDWDALGCLRPHVVTRVTEHVESDIVPYIQRLVDHGMAYQIGNNTTTSSEDSDSSFGGVYFDVRAYEERMGTLTRYGKLAPPQSATDLFSRQPPPEPQHGEQESASALSGDGTDVVKKRDPRDFVLWKERKTGEEMYWSSPWGQGRPGWHIECSAMIEAVQTQFRKTHTFTIHTGGIDLKFPHHTNEIAQAEAYRFSEALSETGPQDEWIRHWIHTGHLHIDGLKMSKSLKNFITIKELLSDVAGGAGAGLTSTLSSSADDFRLWCLGLSGPYRGNATYSKQRMHESRNIRNKIVRFLLSGEEWQRRQHDKAIAPEAETVATKKWRDEDYSLFVSVNDAAAKSRQALLSDLDGSTYVEQMVRISEEGMSYLNQDTTANGPTEPMLAAIRALRDLLSLVGFSDATCRAGMSALVTSTEPSSVVGGDRALIDELTRFRSSIRRAAIDDHKDKTTTTSQNMKQILQLCDEARDKVFPVLGVEFMDGGVTGDGDGKQSADDWRFCVPRSPGLQLPSLGVEYVKHRKAIKSGNLQSLPAEILFRVGKYEGLFSEYDEEGFPTRNADGSAISNTKVKEMRKILAKHCRYHDKVRKKRTRLQAKKAVYTERRETRERVKAEKESQ